MRNFNEIFKKNVTYDNMKTNKKQSFTLSLEYTFLEKPGAEGVGQTDLPTFLGLIKSTRFQKCYAVFPLLDPTNRVCNISNAPEHKK